MNRTMLMAAALTSATTLSQSAAAQNIMFKEFDLDNGLHVILHQDRSTPIVAVSVMYHVGSKDEDPTRRGFAHFFEHLLFEGSKNIERGEFGKYVEKAGGTLNANTTADRTYYYEILPSNQLELGLWLESERMLHAKVDQVGIETQREVVKEERRQRYENQPYGSILIEVLKRAYTVHPYQWPTIGFMEDLNAATEKDFQKFYQKYYTPNNAVLCIAGDIDPAEVKQLAIKYFGDIPKGATAQRDIKEEPPMKGEVRDTIYDEVQLPAVVQAYRIPAYGADDFYAVDMVNRLLSQGNSSRLQKSVKDDQELALYVGAFSFPFEHPGLAIAFAIANAGVSAEKLETAMDQEIAKVRKEPISDEEFQRLRAQIETEFMAQNSRMAGVASNLCSAYTFMKNTDLVNTEVQKYLAVTKEDLQVAATKYFAPEQRVVLYYLPKSQKQ